MAGLDIKEQALALRREGWTYREIRAAIPVAKSTLSLWFRSANLSNRQLQSMTDKRRAAGLRGASARRKARVAEVARYLSEGQVAVGTLTRRELWLIGTALYWAEGSKQSERSISTGLVFGNMDAQMIQVYLSWLELIGIGRTDLLFSLYVHEDKRAVAPEYAAWWANVVKTTTDKVSLYYKKGNPATNRANRGDLYRGILRIKVRTSTVLNRRVKGWTAGIVAALGSGVTGNTSAFEAEDSRIVP